MRCPRRALTVLQVVLLGLEAAACDGGAPPARGFSSRQLVSTRDPTFSFSGWLRPGLIVYSTRPEVAGGASDYWLLDLVSGQAREVGPNPPSPDDDPNSARFSCTSVSGDAANTLVVVDHQTGATTSIDSVPSQSLGCPTDGDTTMVVWRFDAGGVLSVWTGPYDDLHRVPVDLSLQMVANYDMHGATVVAASLTAPDASGLYAIDLATGAATELVPAALGAAAWAPGATAAGSLLSASLARPHGTFGDTVVPVGDHFIYPRAMSDGGTTIFAGPLPSSSGNRELALLRLDSPVTPIFTGARSPFGGLTPLPPDPRRIAWLRYDSAGGGDLLTVWDEGRQRITSCPLPLPPGRQPPIGIEAATPGNVLFVANVFSNEYQDTIGNAPDRGPLLLVRPGDDGDAACVPLAADDVIDAGISDGGGSIFWLSAPATGDRTLWTAAGDGSGARLAGPGNISLPAFSGETELEFEFGPDLVWLDVRDVPAHLHYIAERVFGERLDLTPPWLLTGYRFDRGEQTGSVGVIDRHAGTTRLISPAVAWYQAVPVSALDASAGSLGRYVSPLGILYLVRGHNPSPQDGLWLATITADDLR